MIYQWFLFLRAFSLYDIQFEQAKFTKKTKKGRKKKEDNEKENLNSESFVGCFYEMQFKQLLTQVNIYISMRQQFIDYYEVNQQQYLQQKQKKQQDELFPIFNKPILLCKPQTVKKARTANRLKKILQHCNCKIITVHR